MRGQKRATGGPFLPLRHRFWPFDREYLENGKSQRYIKLNISSTRVFTRSSAIANRPRVLRVCQYLASIVQNVEQSFFIVSYVG